MATITAANTDQEKRRDFNTSFKQVQVQLSGGTIKLERFFSGTDEADENNWQEIKNFTQDGAEILQEMRGSYRVKITSNARIDI